MTVTLDKASSARSKCCFCKKPIERDTVRVTDKPRHAHLPCAIEHDRGMAREALVSPSTSPKLVSEVLAEVSRLDPELADAARTGYRKIKMTRVPPKPLDDPRTVELLRDIERDPANRDAYAVLADHLQHLGDERGELIVLDLSEPLSPSALVRRRELAGSLSPQFDKHAARFSWGIGFLRKIELPFVDGNLGDYREQFAHPSCRFLEVLHIGTNHRLRLTIPAGVLPPSLRTLIVTSLLAEESDLALPNLTHLTLMDTEAPIAHPTLRSLTLVSAMPETLEMVQVKRLPAVTKLSIDHVSTRDFAVTRALELGGWLAQLAELSMSYVVFDRGDHEVLERGLAGRKLAKLSIHTLGNAPVDRARLSRLCDELDAPDRPLVPTGTVYIEHASKPEWGRGRLVREFDGKVEVEFPSGRRTLKANAPFLIRITG